MRAFTSLSAARDMSGPASDMLGNLGAMISRALRRAQT
jgi:hypothetical protein